MDSLNCNVEPSTLRIKEGVDSFAQLYRRYGKELTSCCERMGAVRKRMLAKGCTADFSDRESELLYLLLRELKPDVMVEISPCYGYSTNYILEALTANNKGKVYSFEIQTHFKGEPIAEVIDRNLSENVDKSRLELRVGNVMEAAIPDCEFLFIDSCHEAYFSAWYFSQLIHKPTWVFVHDIAIFDKKHDTLVPKAALMGVREQYYVLETLSLNRQQFLSAAEFDAHMDKDLKRSLPVRDEGARSERSIVFQGHCQSESAQAIHKTQPMIEDMKQSILRGFREDVLSKINAMVSDPDCPPFSKFQAYALLPQMGYRYPAHKHAYPPMDIDYEALSVSQLVTLLDAAISACNYSFVRELLRKGRRSKIAPAVLRYLRHHYLAMSNSYRFAPAQAVALLRRALPKG